MARVKFRNFTKGWMPQGARDGVPQGSLRRATGIAPIKTTALRSRWGSTLVGQPVGLNIHTVHRFNGLRLAGVDTTYVRFDETTHPATPHVIETGLDGTKLQGVKAPPTLGVTDYWFVAGGAKLFKVAPDGTTSQWGIDPPPNGFTATKSTPRSLSIDVLDNAASWTAANCTLADEGTIKQQGTNSMKMTVLSGFTGTATKAIGIDLTAYTGPAAPSPNEDFITVWVRVDLPENLYAITLAFDVGAANFATDYFSAIVVSTATLPPQGQQANQVAGAGSLAQFQNNDAAVFSTTTPEGIQQVQDALAQNTIPPIHNNWVLVRVPKALFQRAGANGATFASVAAVRLSAQANGNGPVTVYWDDLKLGGGTGMQGTYAYQVVFFNHTTGSRSNPNSLEVTVPDVARGAVSLANLPISADPQVTHLEVYRTVGNGTLKFLALTLTNGTTTATDGVGDFFGLDSSGANVLSSFQLQLDNARPDDSWDDAFGLFAGCMFWTRSPNVGEKGRLFYSPPGRSEAAPNFLDITGDDEPLKKGVVWNGAIYLWSTEWMYQVVGTGPFIFRRLTGAVGTLWPFTVTITPYGIAYLAHDGPRMFDGNISRLIAPGAADLIFKSEFLEGIIFTT